MQNIESMPRPEIILVADTVAREKNIDKEDVFTAMEVAIQKAGRSKYGFEHDIRANIDRKTGAISLARYREVVEGPENVENEVTQLTLEDAKMYDANAKVGDFIIDQLPPMYSAVWVDGQRLYKLARAGKEVERPTRQVTIHRLDLLEFDPENRTCVIDVACSKGTYIRTLCHDIGEALCCGGMLTALRRTETLGFTTADCHTLEELKQASEEGRFEELLMPVDAAFRQYKSIFLSPKQSKMFLDGIRLDTNRIKIPAEGDTVRVYGDGRFLALAHIERSIAELQIIKLFYTKENPNC